METATQQQNFTPPETMPPEAVQPDPEAEAFEFACLANQIRMEGVPDAHHSSGVVSTHAKGGRSSSAYIREP
jgi:hypothetical protein